MEVLWSLHQAMHTKNFIYCIVQNSKYLVQLQFTRSLRNYNLYNLENATLTISFYCYGDKENHNVLIIDKPMYFLFENNIRGINFQMLTQDTFKTSPFFS
jgi:hypothetical protein